MRDIGSPKRQGDHGEGAVGYIAFVTLLAGMTGCLATGGIGQRVSSEAVQAICRVIGDDCGTDERTVARAGSSPSPAPISTLAPTPAPATSPSGGPAPTPDAAHTTTPAPTDPKAPGAATEAAEAAEAARADRAAKASNAAIAAAQALAAPGLLGANDWSCKPNKAHQRPVVLVHGTFVNGTVNWVNTAPTFALNGYCVFALTYGELPGVPVLRATAPVSYSAGQLSTFVDGVLAATGSKEVDIVGYSQGGMMPRYYLKYMGGADKVNTLVGLAPSNHGTTLSGLSRLAEKWPEASDTVASACPACSDQLVGSPLMARLNDGADTVPGVNYTVISSRYDEVVTPYGSQFLTGPNVRNVTLQDLCPLDSSGHLSLPYDPIAMNEVFNTLDPRTAAKTHCLSHPLLRRR